MIRASIIGVTGYTGGELLKLLLQHPEAKVVHCTSESSFGKSLSAIHLALTSQLKRMANPIIEKCDVRGIAKDSDVVFLCLPHGNAAKMGQRFLEKGVKVIDLSADFRLKSKALYQQWYQTVHPYPKGLEKAVYGLPELHRSQIQKTSLVANPGCYATACILSALPLLKNDLVRLNSIIMDAKSGVSGAGKKLEPRYLFCETQGNFLAYGVGQHRHMPEIEQELTFGAGGKKVSITFVPHLLPIHRGILVSLYAELKKKISSKNLWKTFATFYQKEPFVSVLPQGHFPEIRSVQLTNFCHLGVGMDEPNQRVIVIGAIDNLGKGASSQAVQNMNLMFGLEETCGLG
jgi:N-acetyl-gamma-glutamyl-phosphate reductase